MTTDRTVPVTQSLIHAHHIPLPLSRPKLHKLWRHWLVGAAIGGSLGIAVHLKNPDFASMFATSVFLGGTAGAGLAHRAKMANDKKREAYIEEGVPYLNALYGDDKIMAGFEKQDQFWLIATQSLKDRRIDPHFSTDYIGRLHDELTIAAQEINYWNGSKRRLTALKRIPAAPAAQSPAHT